MKRLTAALATALLLFSACGGGDDAVDALATPLPESTDAPEATKDAADDEADTKDDAAGDEPEATEKASSSKDDSDDEPAENTEPDSLVIPEAGTYTFNAKGEATDPTNPTAPPQKYEGTATAEITRSGTTVTREDSADNSPGNVTLVTKYDDTKIHLVSFKAETTAGDFNCTLDPPIVIATFPVKVGQKFGGDFKGSGNACEGSSVSIQVTKQEAAKDANGKSWDTWVIVVKQITKSGQLSTNSEQTRWISPELGVEVKTSGKTSGSFGATKFSGSGTTVLKDHP
jgi:hypothetical protein